MIIMKLTLRKLKASLTVANINHKSTVTDSIEQHCVHGRMVLLELNRNWIIKQDIVTHIHTKKS